MNYWPFRWVSTKQLLNIGVPFFTIFKNFFPTISWFPQRFPHFCPSFPAFPTRFQETRGDPPFFLQFSSMSPFFFTIFLYFHSFSVFSIFFLIFFCGCPVLLCRYWDWSVVVVLFQDSHRLLLCYSFFLPD